MTEKQIQALKEMEAARERIAKAKRDRDIKALEQAREDFLYYRELAE